MAVGMSEDQGLSPDRPWERQKAEKQAPIEPAVKKKSYKPWVWLLVVVVIVVALAVNASSPRTSDGPCEEAQQAYVLANGLDDDHDAQIAAMQYAVKKAECEAEGGVVPN